MMRITEQSMMNNSISSIKRNFQSMEASQNRLSTGERIRAPHEDVTSTVNSIYYRTRLSSIEQFKTNIDDAKGRLDVIHSSQQGLTEVFQRARELAVQAANGTYTADDRKNMAFEVEQLIRRTHEISLTKHKDEYIFSGNSTKTPPFRLEYRQNDALGEAVVVAAHYEGDNGEHLREIEEGKTLNVGSPGNFSFWAENSNLTSKTDSSLYAAKEDSAFLIDGMRIEISRGDNIEAVVDKINASGGNVKASIAVLRGGEKVLSLTTREPHKIMMQDLEGGRVLQDMGMIREGMANIPESNYAPGLKMSGHSVYEVLMKFRDSLLSDDISQIGSADLGLIDESLANIAHNQSRVSAKVERIDLAYNSFEDERMSVTEALSKLEDVDYASEMVEFKMWEYVHNASLQTAAKLYRNSLMDYLR